MNVSLSSPPRHNSSIPEPVLITVAFHQHLHLFAALRIQNDVRVVSWNLSIKHSTLETSSVMLRILSRSYSCSPLTFASRTASYSWPVAAAMGRAAATEKQRANPTNHRADRQATQQHLKMSDRRDDFACMISHSQVSHVDFRLHDFAFQVLRTWSAKSCMRNQRRLQSALGSDDGQSHSHKM